jgi:DNA-binding response OmpR family regulator
MRLAMADTHHDVRVIVMGNGDTQGEIHRQLAPIGVTVASVRRAAELSQFTHKQNYYQVALLPAVLPDSDWWTVWGVISLFDPRPTILVYAHRASFQLWSGVLEAGGYDVIVEPFAAKELQRAVLRAAKSFEERYLNEGDDD